MAFGRIKNKTANKVIVSQGPVSTLYSQALSYEELFKYEKEPILRPSGFPTCSILSLIKMAQYDELGYIPDRTSLHSEFFTSVGTVVHEVVQKWMGNTNNILGDWQCVNPKCKRSKCVEKTCKDKNCTKHEHIYKARKVGNICKLCNSHMSYHEIEVEYKIITGHVDCIIRITKDSFWAADYKTLSLKKIQEIKEPSINYIYQISSYAYILKHEYGIPIDGYSIFYITRDNPSCYKEFSYDFDSMAEKKAKKMIDIEIKKHKSAAKSFKTYQAGDIDLSHVIETKPCANVAQYEKLMGPYRRCEFVDICFSSEKKLKQEINKKLCQK